MRPARAVIAAIAILLLSACGQPAAPGEDVRADPRNADRVALGARIYTQNCVACHGAKLEGQPEWRSRLPSGRLPAPPHDESGHTWHHPDGVLFAITKHGLVPPYAPKDYASDMPAYAGKLSDDEIWAVLAYIKSHWKTPELLAARAEIARNAAKR